MEFADRWLLWILGPLLLLWAVAWFVLPRLRGLRGGALRFSTLRQLLRIERSRSLALRRIVQGLRLLTLALLLVAMARPQTGRRLTQVQTQGIDIVLVVDTSGSMQALDLDADRPIARRRNRLEIAKAVVEEFVARRENDQIGLVVFGEQAFTQCPLTLDHGIVATFLEQVEIGMAGDATAIGDAIGIAARRLRDSVAKSKVIILLTDGRSNAGRLSPRKAAEVAEALGIKIYAIGAGTRGKAPFIAQTGFGQTVVYQDVEIDEEGLEAIAEKTGGAYFRAEDLEALNAVYETIDQLEKTEITMEAYMEYNEEFTLFVWPALGLLLLETVLLGTRFRKLP